MIFSNFCSLTNICSVLSQDVMAGKNLLSAMDEIKAVLVTPLKLAEEDDRPPVDDLPSQIIKVFGKGKDVNQFKEINTKLNFTFSFNPIINLNPQQF